MERPKTKNMRFDLQIHLVDQARTGVALEQWSITTRGKLRFMTGNLIGDYCDGFGATGLQISP